MRIYAERRPAQARRTVDTQWRQQSDQEPNACQQLGRTPVAGEADARQALATCEPTLPTLSLAARTVRAPPRSSQRGRPRPEARPDQVVDQIDGALASTLTARQARSDQHGCVILATTALDPTQRPPLELLAGSKGQVHVERGCRCLQDPQCFASVRSLQKPERLMALLLVMTVCLLVYAAVAYRSRQALHDHTATFPDQRGRRMQPPTARWVFHDFVGIHV